MDAAAMPWDTETGQNQKVTQRWGPSLKSAALMEFPVSCWMNSLVGQLGSLKNEGTSQFLSTARFCIPPLTLTRATWILTRSLLYGIGGICVCACMCVDAHTQSSCMRSKGQRRILVSASITLCLSLFRQGLPPNPKFSFSAGLAGQWVPGTGLSPPLNNEVIVMNGHDHPFYMGSGDSNQGPHACTTSVLTQWTISLTPY